MRGKLFFAFAAALVILVASAAWAAPLRVRAGDIVIVADGGFAPQKLPRHRNAPITIFGRGSIGTHSGELPPILRTIAIEFDRHGAVETRGLAVCTAGRLQSTTVPVARRNCPGAIIGRGYGRAVVKFPDQAPIPIGSPITLFNGPKKRGREMVFAHAYTTIPAPVALIVPIVIQRIHKGLYGYRTEARIPTIAGGYGIPVAGSLKIGRKWKVRGRLFSYVNARCATGRLQARAEFTFSDATVLRGTFLRPCRVRR